MSVPVYDRNSTQSPFRIDEGYSEEPRCQDVDEMVDLSAGGDTPAGWVELSSSTREWLLSQPVDVRAGLARLLLTSLPTSYVSDIVQEANLRLHFDPVAFLPQELVTGIFSNLEPQSLLAASQVSKSWRARAQDPLLWRRQYVSEGWTYNSQVVGRLNETIQSSTRPLSSTPRGKIRPLSSISVARAGDVKRRRDRSGQAVDPSYIGDIAYWNDQNAPVVADEDMKSTSESETDRVDELMRDAPDDLEDLSPSMDLAPLTKQDFILELGERRRHFHWQHLYTQRMRLEQNWNNGKYTNFRLPSLDHPNEGHTQCVYTVQYSANHLVSGSRDMTVRVWDLEKGRLKLPPLMGHDASVLCLQFDETPSEDVIISGGSDASVIVWKFSTGEMVKKIRRAHGESVLNLRFDSRYLITCSKDKTIKVWSRKALTPSDDVYPKITGHRQPNSTYPQYIIPLGNQSVPQSVPGPGALEAYTHIMTLEGHSAAINAIAIHGDQLASASGDRKVILWDLKKGRLIRQFLGHTKGIACVQYDGRRIVSGSSDHTVRIFDSDTSAELGILEGHSGLVRTVQADFSDNLTEMDEVYEATARAQDQAILDRERQRNSQSSVRLQRGEAIGLHIPRGGGGNRWSKILSGSYDETVIIWKVDKEGRWYIGKELRQEAAMRATGGRVVNPVLRRHRHMHHGNPPPHHHHHHHHHHHQNGGPQQPPQLPITTTTNHSVPSPQPSNGQTASQPSQNPSNQQPLQHPSPAGVNGQQQAQNQGHGQAQQPPPSGNQAGQQQQQQQQQQQGAGHVATNPWVQAAQQELHGGLNSRVFKLQFDARRIIACSQETVIVGWDFANGDSDIVDACRFFGEPQG